MTPSRSAEYDIAVIGAGIAGASVAACLGETLQVVLLEREPQPGSHATGRSAAIFSETYGPEPIRALSRASRQFFEAPPTGFADHPLLSPRGVLLPARPDQSEALERAAAAFGDKARRLSGPEVEAIHPLLRAGYATAGLLEPNAREIDVAALLAGFLRQGKARGVELRPNAAVIGLERSRETWRIDLSDRSVTTASIIVNAAGAWADEVAETAGVRPLGVIPKRRTAVIVDAPEGVDLTGVPMLVDIEERFYVKPEAGRLLLSPADATPTPPCDVQPDEMDIAVAVDRVMQALDISVRRVHHRWAGLRSFVADGVPVVGFGAPSFFWLAGQGGYGIQTAPAMAMLAAAMIKGQAVPEIISREGLDPEVLSPTRSGLSAIDP